MHNLRWRSQTVLASLLMAALSACSMRSALCPSQSTEPQLLVRLPAHCNTPDGATLAADGSILVSVPNFNNDALISAGKIEQPAAARIIRIDDGGTISDWYVFNSKDLHPSTGRIGPMDIAFGPDGHLYVADLQVFWNAERKSRLVRIETKQGIPTGMSVVVEGFIAANGLVWKGDTLFVTDSILGEAETTSPDSNKPGLLSAVYAFDLAELGGSTVQLEQYDPAAPDSHTVHVFTSSNRMGFGADGVAVDSEGNLFTSIVEDGKLYKTRFDQNGRPLETELFVGSGMSSADGLSLDASDGSIYVADFLGNAVHRIDSDGRVHTLHSNADTDGADGSLDQPCDVQVRGDELIVVNMDMPIAPAAIQTNTQIDEPYTISVFHLR